jgi:uncharacterized membrane protein YgdD (TMEM256/DUF423 family)
MELKAQRLEREGERVSIEHLMCTRSSLLQNIGMCIFSGVLLIRKLRHREDLL